MPSDNNLKQKDGFGANAPSKQSSLRIIVMTEQCLRLVKLTATRLFGDAAVFFKAYKQKGKDHEAIAKEGVFRKKQSSPVNKPRPPGLSE